MDRVPLSRILAAVAKLNNVPSIGIQPQIISTGPRYVLPAVERMGVIDSSQVEIFQQLGALKESLFSVGSVNLISRLMKIEEHRNKIELNTTSPTILFALQHSNPAVMISIAIALKEICKKNGAKLIVKPHPHQETTILHEIRELYANCDYVRIMPKNGDTYEYLATSSLVVGLFSSVLLEAAISGVEVIVANFLDLDKSVNFAQIGLALESKNPENLEYSINDILTQGPLSRQLKNSRENYLHRNPHLQKPYSYKALENFINSNIISSPQLIKDVVNKNHHLIT